MTPAHGPYGTWEELVRLDDADSVSLDPTPWHIDDLLENLSESSPKTVRPTIHSPFTTVQNRSGLFVRVPVAWVISARDYCRAWGGEPITPPSPSMGFPMAPMQRWRCTRGWMQRWQRPRAYKFRSNAAHLYIYLSTY